MEPNRTAITKRLSEINQELNRFANLRDQEISAIIEKYEKQSEQIKDEQRQLKREIY